MEQASSPAGMVVKNTFLDCDLSSEEDDAVEVRKVRSAPAKPVDGLPQSTSLFKSLAKMMRLTVDTSDDVEGVARSPEVKTDSKDKFEAEETSWPATPEGHFLPSYPRLSPSVGSAAEDMHSVASESKGDATSSWSNLSVGTSSLFLSRGLESREGADAHCLATVPQQMTMQGSRGSAMQVATDNSSADDFASQSSQSARSDKGQLDAAKDDASAAASSSSPPSKSMSIAQLQELLQSGENTARFKFPAGVKVLQWSYHTQRDCPLAHRAVISFLCNGVPNHFAGQWQPCKKTARQSAAEMALRRLNKADMADAALADACIDLAHLEPSSRNTSSAAGSASKDHIKKMENYLRQIGGGSKSSKTIWECEERTGTWRALARVAIAGMGHTFVGPALESSEAARAELACRVLWLLGYRSCRGLYVVDRRKWISSDCAVPEAPVQWSQVVQETMPAMDLQ